MDRDLRNRAIISGMQITPLVRLHYSALHPSRGIISRLHCDSVLYVKLLA